MLTAQRLPSGKLQASPLAYRQNMFLSGAGSPWSLMTLLLLLLSVSFSLSLSVFFFFFVMLSFHSPPTHCCSLKLSRGWTPHCFCPCARFSKSAMLDVDVEQLRTLFDLFLFNKEEGSRLGQLHCAIHAFLSSWLDYCNSLFFTCISKGDSGASTAGVQKSAAHHLICFILSSHHDQD